MPASPLRLLSLVPSMTETLFAFGLGDSVVGVTDYCTQPPEGVASKARVGGPKNPDIEKIIALRPDLVVMNVEENRKADADALRAAGVHLHVEFPKSLREGLESLRRLAQVTHSQSAAQPLLDAFERALDETERFVAVRPRVRVFCAIWKNPYMTVNADTYVSDFIETCGGINVFRARLRRWPLAAEYGQSPPRPDAETGERDRRYPRVSLSEVAAQDPEVILLLDEPYPFSEKDFADFEAFPQMNAVLHGHIHVMDGKTLSWCGPRAPAGLVFLRELLAGKAP